MSEIKPVSLEQCAALAKRMAANPAEAVHQMGQLSKWLHDMGPLSSEILSRYEFERASIATWAQTFDLGPGEEDTLTIVLPRDAWIRGINAVAQVVVPAEFEDIESIVGFYGFVKSLTGFGTNNRWLFDCKWSLDDDQAFQSIGASGRTEAPATSVTGDGEYSATVDWKLQHEDVVSIFVRNKTNTLIDPAAGIPGFDLSITVALWAQPTEQRRELRGP